MSIFSWWVDPQRALFFFWCDVFFQRHLDLAPCGCTTEDSSSKLVPLGPDMPGIVLLYDVLYA